MDCPTLSMGRMARIIGGLMEVPIEQAGSGYQPGMHALCVRLQRALDAQRLVSGGAVCICVFDLTRGAVDSGKLGRVRPQDVVVLL